MANALTERYRTLGELMTELRARLGFVTQGPASSSNEQIMRSFLQEGHDYVFEKLQPPAQRKISDLALIRGSRLYDWINDADGSQIDPGRVLGVWLMEGDEIYTKLRQRGDFEGRPDEDEGQPSSYAHLAGQMEIYPVPDGNYTLRIEYLQDKNRFTQPSDRPSVPDRLVFLYALANAKAHYRHPDSQAAGATFESMLAAEKSKQREGKRYFIGAGGQQPDLQVVRTSDGGYKLG